MEGYFLTSSIKGEVFNSVVDAAILEHINSNKSWDKNDDFWDSLRSSRSSENVSI